MNQENQGSSGNLHTSDELKEMQAWPLDWKIQISKQKIAEWYEQWGGRVVVAFSGGKDSTVLLHLVRTMYPSVEAVFCDTGLEYPEIKDFVKTFENVTIVRPEISFRQVIHEYGYPLISKEVSGKIQHARNKPNGKSAELFEPNNYKVKKYGQQYSLERWKWLKESDIPISDKCCYVMKKKPVNNFLKLTNSKVILGTMATESRIRKNSWLKHGCNSFDGRAQHSAPLSIWTNQDILQYIINNNLKIAPVYGDIILGKDGELQTTGCKRTGCVFCAFGAHLEKEPNRFQMLKQTHPKLWEYCMRPFEDGGLGMREVLSAIKVKIE